MNKWMKWAGACFIATAIACATMIPGTGGIVVEAQSLPYTITVAWTAPADGSAVSYNCYLDGVQVVTGVTATTCQFPIAVGGPHTVGVTSVNPSFVPTEGIPATIAFTLKAPGSPTGVKVK